MGMLANIMIWGLSGWFIGLGIIIAYRCLSGGVGLAGLLAQDATAQAAGRPAPERVQLLVMFLIALVGYAQIALRAQGSHHMPDAPHELVALFAGSHGIYLSGKLTRVLRDQKNAAHGRKKELP